MTRNTRFMTLFVFLLGWAVSPQTFAQDKEINAKSIEALRAAIDHAYAYRDLRVKDWNSLFDQYRPDLEKAATPREFATTAARLLSAAKDVHLTVIVDGEKLPSYTGSTNVHPKCNPDILPQIVPNWKQHNSIVSSGRFTNRVQYLYIGIWVAKNPKDFQPVFDLIDQLETADSLIIDVRHNYGGADSIAESVAGCFVTNSVVYAKSRKVSDRSADGYTEVRERVLEPNKEHRHFSGRVVVLMGPKCVSTTESFLLMMREAPACTLLGESSYGASGAPRPNKLPNGVIVLLPSGQAMDKNGNLIEGKGVPPDIAVESRGQDFSTGDPILMQALLFLKKGAAKKARSDADGGK